MNFHKSFTSPFPSTLTPQPDPPWPDPPPPKKKIKKKKIVWIFTKASLLHSHPAWPPNPNPSPRPPNFCPPPFRRKAEGHSFRLSFRPSFRPPKVLCTLCAQLLLQFYADLFETLQMFLSWSEDMHVIWILSWDYFFSLFPQFELSHFLGVFTIKVNRYLVPCVRNSSYSFMPIPLKLHKWFVHGLKICMCFEYNPQIIFITFSVSWT